MESDSTPTPGLRDLRTGTGPGYRPASSQWPVMRAAETVPVTPGLLCGEDGGDLVHGRVGGEPQLRVFAQCADAVLERAAALGAIQVRLAVPVRDVHQLEARLRGDGPVQPCVPEEHTS